MLDQCAAFILANEPSQTGKITTADRSRHPPRGGPARPVAHADEGRRKHVLFQRKQLVGWLFYLTETLQAIDVQRTAGCLQGQSYSTANQTFLLESIDQKVKECMV